MQCREFHRTAQIITRTDWAIAQTDKHHCLPPPPQLYSAHSRWLPPCRMAPTSARYVCWRMPGGWPVSGRRRTVISSRCAWTTSTVCWTSTHWCGRRWRPLPQKGMHAGWGTLCPCISVSGWWTDEWMDKVHIGCVARPSLLRPSATEQIMHYWAACTEWTTPDCKTTSTFPVPVQVEQNRQESEYHEPEGGDQ